MGDGIHFRLRLEMAVLNLELLHAPRRCCGKRLRCYNTRPDPHVPHVPATFKAMAKPLPDALPVCELPAPLCHARRRCCGRILRCYNTRLDPNVPIQDARGASMNYPKDDLVSSKAVLTLCFGLNAQQLPFTFDNPVVLQVNASDLVGRVTEKAY